MLRIIPVFIWTVCASAIIPAIFVPPLIAHQQKTVDGNLEVMLHLDPNDFPYAKKPTLTWFMLMRRNGDYVSPDNCNCQVSVYNDRNQPIAPRFPLSKMQMEGHKKEHEAIRTTITFPKPGSYTVVLSGRPKDGSFTPFELKFPIAVRPQSTGQSK